MAALAAAVRPFAGGGVPRRTAPASELASGKKKLQSAVVAPARDSSVCLAGVEELYVPSSQNHKMMTCNRSNVIEAAAADDKKVSTVGGGCGGEMSARELLQKRLTSELDVLRGLLKKAELISRRGACNGGGAGGAPPTAGDGKKKERFLASKQQRSEPMEDGGGNAASVKRRKISKTTLVEQEQKQVWAPAPPRISAEERSQLAARLSSLSGELPGLVVEFLLKQYGDDADAGGEIEINIDSVEDSVLFELKTELDKFAQEQRRPVVVDVLPEVKHVKLAEESKSNGILQQEVKTGSRPSSRSSVVSDPDPDTDGGSARERCSDELPAALREVLPNKQIVATSAQLPPSEPPAQAVVQRSGEAKKVIQDVQRAAAPKAAVYMPGLIYRANIRRQLLEMERAVLPDDRIHRRDLQRVGIAEYGHPGIMRHLGLVLRADDA